MSSKDPAIEYTVWLDGGYRFHTGGFDEARTIIELAIDCKPIDGCFGMDNANKEWTPTLLNYSAIVAVQDRR